MLQCARRHVQRSSQRHLRVPILGWVSRKSSSNDIPRAAALFERAAKVLPSGVTHDSRFIRPFPIYAERAAGSHKWDVDGHEYIDYVMGHGALLLGHNYPAVTEAALAQLGRGHALRREPGAGDRVGGGGRAARALRRDGALHELWHRGDADGAAAGAGVHGQARRDQVRTPLPRLARLRGGEFEVRRRRARRRARDRRWTASLCCRSTWRRSPRRWSARGDVGAVIIESAGASSGTLPVPRGFLQALRAFTAERGIVLIMDEVVTGFRWAPGGVQEVEGVRPGPDDAGEDPRGRIPGRRGRAGGAMSWPGSSSPAPGERPKRRSATRARSTRTRSPRAAGVACLRGDRRWRGAAARERKRGAASRGNECRALRARHPRRRLRAVERRPRAPRRPNGAGSGGLRPARPPLGHARRRLAAGSTTASRSSRSSTAASTSLGTVGLVSAVHTPEDIAETVDAWAGALAEMRAEGVFV